MGRCYQLRYIVRLTQMLKRWRIRALKRVPSDVPPGHVAVCGGHRCRRFIVRVKYLNHFALRKLLCEAEEEYGFENSDGPIFIPCDESVFEEALPVVTRSDELRPSRCRVVMTESVPLLHGVSKAPLLLATRLDSNELTR